MNNLFLKGNTVLHGPEKDLAENERYYRTLIHSLRRPPGDRPRLPHHGFKQHGLEKPCKNAAGDIGRSFTLGL